MRFEFAHTFLASPEELASAMFSENIAPFLSEHVPSVEGIEAISREESENEIRRTNKYRPVPVIRKIATKTVRPEWMHWMEKTVYNKKRQQAEFENIPVTKRVAELFLNKGTIRFTPLANGKTQRTIAGELTVKVFMLGKIAERLIYPQAKKIIEEEAKALASFLLQTHKTE